MKVDKNTITKMGALARIEATDFEKSVFDNLMEKYRNIMTDAELDEEAKATLLNQMFITMNDLAVNAATKSSLETCKKMIEQDEGL